MIIGKILEETVKRNPDKPALIGSSHSYRYSEFLTIAKRVASLLQKMGLKKGDRVGVLARKTPETILAYVGMGLVGIVGVPLSFHYPQELLGSVIDSTGCKALFVDYSLLTRFSFLAKLELPKIIIGGDLQGSATWTRDILDGTDESFADAGVKEDDVFYLNFTSGSTGEPKAVETTHSHIHWNTLASNEVFNFTADDVHLVMFAVFSHPHELFARPLWTGGTIVLVDSLYPKSIAHVISEYKVTAIMGLAPMYEMMIPFAGSDRYDFSSLRIAESGGMFTNLSLQKRFNDAYGIGIRPVWGSTETTGIALASPENIGITKSCGKVAPYYSIKIIDTQGNEVSPGETGQMILKGPAVVDCYLNNKIETDKHFHENWFYTGDMVFQDSDGLVYFRGRESGMMKVGGLKVFPQEIEDLIHRRPEIDEVVVVPTYEKLRGEVPVVFIVCKEGEELDENNIKDFCREKLPNYMVPKKIFFRQSLPRTPSGKIDRKSLLDEVSSGSQPSEMDELEQRLEKIDLKVLNLLNERTRLNIRLRELQEAVGKPLFSPGEEERVIKRILGYNSGPLHDEFIEQIFRELLLYITRL